MLEYKKYDVENLLQGQDDAMMCDEVAFEYEGYIEDAINTVADLYVSIYSHKLFNNLEKLYNAGFYNEAIGIVDFSGDILKDIQNAWYMYNEYILDKNRETILYNHAIKYIKDHYPEYVDKLTDDDVADIWDVACNMYLYDFEDIEQTVKDFIIEKVKI
jgi:hypothetical protein